MCRIGERCRRGGVFLLLAELSLVDDRLLDFAVCGVRKLSVASVFGVVMIWRSGNLW